MTTRDDEAQYVMITGKGRSGTTWLARLLATHPRCIYKHEPFLERKRSSFLDLRNRLGSAPRDELRAEFSRLARGCQFDIDQPPFQQPDMRLLPPGSLRRLYQLASRVSAARPVFELLGRPRLRGGDSVLLKDVNFPNELLPELCECIGPHLISIVRNPFSNIASLLQGVELGVFAGAGQADVERVEEILEQPGFAQLAHFRTQLRHLPPAAFEALRWRIQVEPLVELTRKYAAGDVVVYERLCEDPAGIVKQLFERLGWPVGEATLDHIEETTSGPRQEKSSRRAFFSVYRSPAESLHRWKEELSVEQQNEIAGVIRSSPIKNLWPELPV